MAKTTTRVPDSTDLDAIGNLRGSFIRHLRATNRAPSTIVTYTKALDQFTEYLAAHGMPTRAGAITSEHIEAFEVDLQDRGMRPATVSQRHRSLQAFFKWAAAEKEILESPMASMRPPAVPETPPPVLTEDELRRLLKTCDGPGFDERRDSAILRLFLDSGMRRAELAGLKPGHPRSVTSRVFGLASCRSALVQKRWAVNRPLARLIPTPVTIGDRVAYDRPVRSQPVVDPLRARAVLGANRGSERALASKGRAGNARIAFLSD